VVESCYAGSVLYHGRLVVVVLFFVVVEMGLLCDDSERMD
jgi:hypothetical protein